MTKEPGFSFWEEKRFFHLQSIQTGCGAYPDWIIGAVSLKVDLSWCGV